jgi:hypothetical protein
MWFEIILNRLLLKSDKFKPDFKFREARGMTKTERIIQLLISLSNAPSRILSYEQIMPMLGEDYKTQLRVLKELLEGTRVPAILVKIGDGALKSCSFKLNSEVWENFALATTEGRFYFEAFKSLGSLLSNQYLKSDFEHFEETSSNLESLSRKFMYLSKVQANEFNEHTKSNLDVIVDALIKNQFLNITYKKPAIIELVETRKIKPLTLCQYKDDLYLICEKLEDQKKWVERTYKISRIKSAVLLDEKFTYPSNKLWNPEIDYKYTSGLIKGELQNCTVRVFNESRYIFQEKNMFNAELIKSDAQYDEYDLKFTNLNEFVSQLFVYAQDIQIVTNEEVSKTFIDKALSSLLLNQSTALKKVS